MSSFNVYHQSVIKHHREVVFDRDTVAKHHIETTYDKINLHRGAHGILCPENKGRE